MSKVEKGYNIFKADPLFINDRVTQDPGDDTYQFFNLQYDREKHSSYRFMNKFYMPLEYFLTEGGVTRKKSVTKSMTSAALYKKSTESAVKVGAEGSYYGVDLGGSVGISAFSEVQNNAMTKTTTTESSSRVSYYTFELRQDAKFQLTENTESYLKRLDNTANSWFKFFDDYGTHITTKGQVGAWTRTAMKFSQSDRESLTTDERSFQTSLNVGIPSFFGFDLDTTGGTSRTIGNSLQQMNIREDGVYVGDPNSLFNEETNMPPGIISREVVPICKFIDSSHTRHSALCLKHLKSYCIKELRAAGFSTHECKFPSSSLFTCALDSDCDDDPWKRCDAGFCKSRECIQDSDCNYWYQRCDTNDGLCVKRQRRTDACQTCDYVVDTHWTTCTINPGCPSGFTHSRWENGPCWGFTKRRVCDKIEKYACPPCVDRLQGTCGGGKRGNGCCPYDAGCSKWGWCAYGAEYYEYPYPSHDKCRQMRA